MSKTGANDKNGYKNTFTDAVSTEPVTDRASAIDAYTARMTYGFSQASAAGQAPVVPQGAENLLLTAFPDVGDAQRREHLLDERQLGEQVLRRRFAGALVLRQHLVAEGAALHVERDREMVGLLAVQHLGQHRGETPYRVRGLSGLSTEIFRR